MKKALFLGIAASFFFAFTFILNRSMNLAGGYWLWSACLRYLFTLPIMAMLIARKDGIRLVCREIRAQPLKWILWSTVGFGLFYAPLTFGSTFGESWLAAATWQLTIVAGVILTPLWGKRIPGRNLAWSCLILAGVFLLQTPNLRRMDWRTMALTLVPILVAAFSYPLGNRKVMEFCPDWMGTFHRVFAMTLCSIPFWVILSAGALVFRGLPSSGQVVQSLLVAIFSGVVATVLFFRATDLVKQNQRQLAVVEATQSGEVIFTLLGGMLFLGDTAPGMTGVAGIVLIVAGMVGNSLSVAGRRSAN
ncbi:MAG: multidrug resistance efflux transporter family protein [Clostridiales bacterium]|nr:multidrug resistance efflux transporter family protein [Clostridiales bacterium]